MAHKDPYQEKTYTFKPDGNPKKTADGSFKVPANVGDATGWGGNADPNIKPVEANMQSAGYDTSEVESKGHTQEKGKAGKAGTLPKWKGIK